MLGEMAKRIPPVQIDEPIDFERLCIAYQQARWSWTDGISPDRIRNCIASLRRGCMSSTGRYCSSGGLTVRGNEGEIVELAAKIAAFYTPEQKPVVCQTWREFQQEAKS